MQTAETAPRYIAACWACLSSHNVRSTSVKANFPSWAFCSKRWTSHFSRLSAADRHNAIRAWISAVWVNNVVSQFAGVYCMRSKHVTNWDRERLTDVIVAFWVDGSTNMISRTNASSEPPKSWKTVRIFSIHWTARWWRTLTIHPGAFCLQPSTLSVRMTPVFGLIVRSKTSMLTTCEHFGLGYFLHMPITTWDHGWLAYCETG